MSSRIDLNSLLGPGHILSRIYNCTIHGNRPIDNAKTAHLHRAHFDFTTEQIVINCTLKYALTRAYIYILTRNDDIRYLNNSAKSSDEDSDGLNL